MKVRSKVRAGNNANQFGKLKGKNYIEELVIQSADMFNNYNLCNVGT